MLSLCIRIWCVHKYVFGQRAHMREQEKRCLCELNSGWSMDGWMEIVEFVQSQDDSWTAVTGPQQITVQSVLITLWASLSDSKTDKRFNHCSFWANVSMLMWSGTMSSGARKSICKWIELVQLHSVSMLINKRRWHWMHLRRPSTPRDWRCVCECIRCNRLPSTQPDPDNTMYFALSAES